LKDQIHRLTAKYRRLIVADTDFLQRRICIPAVIKYIPGPPYYIRIYTGRIDDYIFIPNILRAQDIAIVPQIGRTPRNRRVIAKFTAHSSIPWRCKYRSSGIPDNNLLGAEIGIPTGILGYPGPLNRIILRTTRTGREKLIEIIHPDMGVTSIHSHRTSGIPRICRPGAVHRGIPGELLENWRIVVADDDDLSV
jgi:hypothetical protein